MAIAPFILAYIVARDHQLTWARGELTAVLSIFAFGALLYVGVIDRPGEPAGQIELEWGWYVALLGRDPHARRVGAAHGGDRAPAQAAGHDL